MLFLLRSLSKPGRHCHSRRTFHDASSINWVRDRALDHAVEKERDLKTVVNLKNLIISEPAKSLPLSVIVQNKVSLGISSRPIDFLRKYRSVFEEFLPGGIGIHPHVKLTQEVLSLDVEELLIYQSEIHKQDVADRLLKLLMIARINKIPLRVIDCLKWDLGLPQDYSQSMVPQFPDYFQVTRGNDEPCLELVCWSDELAVSVIEKKHRRGVPISYPLQYSRGFEIDKKFKKWVDEWQKLPYVSPYENVFHLQPKSDESDKWAVALLHEVLSLLVPKKTEKDNLLVLGEFLGVRSRFKRALLQHPGIFYISSKLGTHTVVLREGYKRDLLIGRPHRLMGMRSKYIHLMFMVKEENKSKKGHVDGVQKKKVTNESKEGGGGGEELKGNESEEEEVSDSEFEGTSDDDYNDKEEENMIAMNRGRPTRKMKTSLRHVQNKSFKRGGRNLSDDDYDDEEDDENENVSIRDKKVFRKAKFDEKMPHRNMRNSSVGRNPGNSRQDDENENVIIRDNKDFRKAKFDEKMPHRNMRTSSVRRNPRNSREDEYDDTEKVISESSINRGRTNRKEKFDKKIPLGTNQRLDRRRGTREVNPPRYLGRRTERSDVPRTREGQF